MAINFREIKEQFENPKLSEDDLQIVAAIEKFIDEKILDQSENENFKIIKVKYSDICLMMTNINNSKKNAVKAELVKRFKNANWKISNTKLYDAGSNESIDYWELKGMRNKKIKNVTDGTPKNP